jgi:hypothetical protein
MDLAQNWLLRKKSDTRFNPLSFHEFFPLRTNRETMYAWASDRFLFMGYRPIAKPVPTQGNTAEKTPQAELTPVLTVLELFRTAWPLRSESLGCMSHNSVRVFE